MQFTQFIRAKNTGMFPKGIITPTTHTTHLPVTYVSPSKDTDAGLYMSTFYPKRITYKGITYPTMEHAYQAEKFRFTDHPTIATKFRHGGFVLCPKKARHMGSTEGMKELGVNLDNIAWERRKNGIFQAIVYNRTYQDPIFKRFFNPY